jgi:hypothetical protein
MFFENIVFRSVDRVQKQINPKWQRDHLTKLSQSLSYMLVSQERRKDLTDHRDDSTFSFDPSKISVKQLDKNKRKRVDSRKGVLLASYTRKKTRRRKRGRGGGCGLGDNNTEGQGQGQQGHSRSATPSPRHSGSAPCPDQRPQSLTLTPPPPTKGPATPQPPAACSEHAPDTLHPANALGEYKEERNETIMLKRAL